MKQGVNTVNLLTLCALAAIQVGYIFVVPLGTVMVYNRLIPVFYAVILTAYIIFMGREKILAPFGDKTASSAMYAAMFILLLYVAAVFLSSILFGAVANRAVSDFPRVVNNLWILAVPAIIGEALRLRIIRSTFKYRVFVIVALVLIFSFAHFNVLNRGVSDTRRFIEAFFILMIPALCMNGFLTYMAFRSPLRVLIIVRCLFLFPNLSPAIPNAGGEIWAAVSCGILFFAVLIYHANLQPSEGGFQRKARKRLIKHSVPSLALLSLTLAIFAAFFLRAFAYFPTVVVTSSMSGEIEIGSVAIVEKIHEDEAAERVRVNDIVLFQRGEREILHRIIEVYQNEFSETVYITQGDANPVPDREPVTTEQIVGVVNSYIPYAGYPVVVIRSLFN